ncbi:MAG: cell division protein FtsQ/DivIB [Panacagrimonas sp.]
MNVAETLPRIPLMPLPRLRIPPGLQAALVLAAIALAAWMAFPRDLALTQLQLRGDFERLRAEDVRTAAEPFLDSGFFATDLAGIRDTVAALPWVTRVRVERQWPGAVTVRAWEREPFARWNESDLLDTEASVFTPRAADIPSGLPQLGGTRGNESEVAQAWQRIAPALHDTPLKLAGLQVDARGEWTARTAGGIELRFGQVFPDERLPVLTGAARRTLEGRWVDVKYIDLRYTNGFAVGWAEGADDAGTEPSPGPSAGSVAP